MLLGYHGVYPLIHPTPYVVGTMVYTMYTLLLHDVVVWCVSGTSVSAVGTQYVI